MSIRWRVVLVPSLVLGAGALGAACPPRPGTEPGVAPVSRPMTGDSAGAPIDHPASPAQTLGDGGMPLPDQPPKPEPMQQGQKPGQTPDDRGNPSLPGPQPPPPPPGVPVDQPPPH